MTPSTTIMEYMAGKADELGIVVVQPEDEISAINMIIGAAYAGVRAMTATSGGGFCLMVEGLGLAGMTETPVVVVDGQRAGPAIGLPTRTEQGDLLFALHAAHGDFPRVVMAPANVEDAFWLTVKAFNLAEEYQLPVIILTDQYLASSYATAERFDLSKVQIRRGQLLSETDPSRLERYKRYEITASGISPRAFPLQSTALVVADSDEHNEEGPPDRRRRNPDSHDAEAAAQAGRPEEGDIRAEDVWPGSSGDHADRLGQHPWRSERSGGFGHAGWSQREPGSLQRDLALPGRSGGPGSAGSQEEPSPWRATPPPSSRICCGPRRDTRSRAAS